MLNDDFLIEDFYKKYNNEIRSLDAGDSKINMTDEMTYDAFSAIATTRDTIEASLYSHIKYLIFNKMIMKYESKDTNNKYFWNEYFYNFIKEFIIIKNFPEYLMEYYDIEKIYKNCLEEVKSENKDIFTDDSDFKYEEFLDKKVQVNLIKSYSVNSNMKEDFEKIYNDGAIMYMI